jgi:hypothetical protein
MQNFLYNKKYELANYISQYPNLYTAISKILSGRDCYTTEKTDIVIDGFPRSANTYATYAFDVAQSKKLIIANHIHKKSQFLLAKKYNIPAILLIRKPLDCISSLLIRQPKYDPATLFKSYYQFYDTLKNLDSYVVGSFDMVLNHYDEIIKKVNQKFNTQFDLYYKTAENEEKVKKIVQTQDELTNVSDYEQRVAYPSAARKQAASNVKKLLSHKQYSNQLNDCNDMYNLITAKGS